MYAIRSSMSSGAIIRLGIIGWDVREHTVSAVMDMPGELTKFCRAALALGEAASVPQDIVASRADLLGVS